MDNIVTNPPFSLAEEFIHHALGQTRRKVVMFLRLAFLESRHRKTTMFEGHTPLEKVIVLSKRVSLMPPTLNKRGKMRSVAAVAYAWFVWQHGHKGPPTLEWM